MSQNIYDRQDFFDAYIKHIDRSHADLEEDLSWKRLRTLVPDVKGMQILDVGCGTGWFCRWAIDNGAQSVLGVDISEKMLAKGRTLSQPQHASIEYQQADLDVFELSEAHNEKYDLVFSSLAFHYLANLPTLIALIRRVLKPGGSLVFNVEHPIYTAPYKPRIVTDPESEEKVWSFNSYYKEGERVIDWLAPGLRKQHRTLTTYMQLFLKQGFSLTGFIEWLPTEEELKAGKVNEIEELRPLFLMMSLRK